ncbi:MAG: hypothetical protein CVU24_07130, partial [Betaproteobacteria bacterium HGW-Betaproteobacteria-18]
MAMGSGGSAIYATLGDDSYTLGAGVDVVLYSSFLQSDGLGYTDTINGFDAANDKIDISALVSTGWDFAYDNATDTLSIDADGDTNYDLVITLTGEVDFTSANFIV